MYTSGQTFPEIQCISALHTGEIDQTEFLGRFSRCVWHSGRDPEDDVSTKGPEPGIAFFEWAHKGISR